MAFLGRHGVVEFCRGLPSPIVLPASAVDAANDRILVNSDALWHCEAVALIGSEAGQPVSILGYLCKDTLDRVTLHTSIDGAANNYPSTRIDLSSIESKPVILFVENGSSQTATLLDFYENTFIVGQSIVSGEVTLAEWPSAQSAYYAAGSEFADWSILASIRSWTLSQSHSAIDTSSIGELFSEAIKASISGSGTFDFIIERFGSIEEVSPEVLIRLAMLTERGGSARARFYLKKDQVLFAPPVSSSMNNRSPIRGSLCYVANILLTNTSIDMSADSIAQGSIDFVTTGEIRLKTQVMLAV